MSPSGMSLAAHAAKDVIACRLPGSPEPGEATQLALALASPPARRPAGRVRSVAWRPAPGPRPAPGIGQSGVFGLAGRPFA